MRSEKFFINTESFFTTYSLGVGTNRDAWCYNYSNQILLRSINTTIDFYLNQSQNVEISVFNMQGQKLGLILPETQLTKGSHSIIWESTNLKSGHYIYVIQAGKRSDVNHITVID